MRRASWIMGGVVLGLAVVSLAVGLRPARAAGSADSSRLLQMVPQYEDRFAVLNSQVSTKLSAFQAALQDHQQNRTSRACLDRSARALRLMARSDRAEKRGNRPSSGRVMQHEG